MFQSFGIGRPAAYVGRPGCFQFPCLNSYALGAELDVGGCARHRIVVRRLEPRLAGVCTQAISSGDDSDFKRPLSAVSQS